MTQARKQIPFFGLDRQFARHADALMAIAQRSWVTGQVMQGPEVARFEAKLARLSGRKHAVAVGSCSDGLVFCLRACGIGAGDEVVLTAYSFVASVNAVLRVGATPRFVDILADSQLMDLGGLEACLGPRTRAVLAVHLFGRALPITALEAFCRARGLLLIEDAAQGLGCLSGSRPAGSMGVASAMSFDPTKVVGSYSNAGAVLTDDDEVARRAVLYRQHGRDPQSRSFEVVGHNSQLPAHLAAMLDYKLDFLEAWQRERRRVAAIYRSQLQDGGGVLLPEEPEDGRHSYHKYLLRAQRRDELAAHLASRGVATMVHYPYLLPDLPFVRAGRAQAGTYPIAARTSGQALSLPIFPELSDEEAFYVSACVRDFYHRKQA